MISEVNPIDRLNALSAYMSRWVDEWPKPKYSFYDFFYKKYKHVIPGTIEHTKAIATHCYYCNVKLKSGRSDHESPNRSSIDHYQPQSKGKTERYVICCAHCNTSKDDVSPAVLVSKMTKAHLKGLPMWGFHGKKLKQVMDQVQVITSDMLYNTGPKIYYIKK